MELSLDTWIISDTHFFHDNIVKYCNRPEDHTERIANAWRSMIKSDDSVLHLGDVFMGIKRDDVNLQFLLVSLTGRKSLIMGNHDKQKQTFYENYGFKVIDPFIARLNNQRIRFSHYPDISFDWDINIHGHIHNNGYRDPLLPNKKYINASIEVVDYKPVRLGELLDIQVKV